MKKEKKSISSQEAFVKHLQHTSPFTWISLGLATITMLAFFAWSFVFKLKITITGEATVNSGQAVLHIKRSDLRKISAGHEVIISEKEWTISFNDGKPVVSDIDLADGDYTFKIVYSKRPIEFIFGN